MVSRVVVDICSIKNSGVLGSQRVAGARISPWSQKVVRGEGKIPLLLLVDLEGLDLELGNYHDIRISISIDISEKRGIDGKTYP